MIFVTLVVILEKEIDEALDLTLGRWQIWVEGNKKDLIYSNGAFHHAIILTNTDISLEHLHDQWFVQLESELENFFQNLKSSNREEQHEFSGNRDRTQLRQEAEEIIRLLQ